MKLILGTVQWGMNYGISNTNGVPTDMELKEIFKTMDKAGIDTLDTAHSYGNAQNRLRSFITDKNKVISKINISNIDNLKIQISESLSNIGLDKFEGFFFQNVKTLIKNKVYWDQAIEIKKSGLVNQIGFSIYNPKDLFELIGRGVIPDIIQIPFNIFDRRFEPHLKRIKSYGIEIHVRSVFLQGLLISSYLTDPIGFEKWNVLWNNYRKWINQIEVSPVDACLNHVRSYDSIDKIVIGITSNQELKEIILAFKNIPLVAPVNLISNDQRLINPIKWI